VLRQAQHERKISNAINPPSVRPERVEACPELVEGGEQIIFQQPAKKLLERVHAAEDAIFNRLQELAQSSDSPDHKAERQAIEDAFASLRVLKRDNLGFPDWEKK